MKVELKIIKDEITQHLKETLPKIPDVFGRIMYVGGAGMVMSGTRLAKEKLKNPANYIRCFRFKLTYTPRGPQLEFKNVHQWARLIELGAPPKIIKARERTTPTGRPSVMRFVKEGEEKFRRRVKRIWIPRWIVRKAMEENIAWIRVKMIEVMELLRRGGRI